MRLIKITQVSENRSANSFFLSSTKIKIDHHWLSQQRLWPPKSFLEQSPWPPISRFNNHFLIILQLPILLLPMCLSLLLHLLLHMEYPSTAGKETYQVSYLITLYFVLCLPPGWGEERTSLTCLKLLDPGVHLNITRI